MHEDGIVETPFAKLIGRFGERLSLRRDAATASWSFDGRTATVAVADDGALEATFADRAVVDAAGTGRVVAIYRAGRYALGHGGGARLVDDMIAFFSGVREPRFAFARIDAEPTRIK